MKKIIIVFIICILAIFSTYILTNYNVGLGALSDNIGKIISRFSKKEEIKYSNEFKVNRLQMTNATYNYNLLNEEQKNIYSSIALSVKDLNKVIKTKNFLGDDLDKISDEVKIAMSAFFADHPEVFYLDMTYKISLSKSILNEDIKIDVTYSVSNLNELEKILDQMDSVIKSYTEKTENMSEFEKELYLHDLMGVNVKYYNDTVEESEIPEKYHTIYGAFMEKQAVCDGFTKAMQILLDKSGIETLFLTGMIGPVPHAWNMVKIDNEWYHLDLTSDKYIKEEDGTTKTIVHTYFNVTDEYIKRTHDIDNKELFPDANSTNNNYYLKTNSYIKSYDNFESRIKELVELQKDKNALEFASDVIDVPTKLLNILYDINFNGYKDKGINVKMKYYNESDTYIIQKK